MMNPYSLTELIRLLKSKPLGTSYNYIVTEGKDYAGVSRSITATASREGLKVSISQILIVDPSTCETKEGVKIIRK